MQRTRGRSTGQAENLRAYTSAYFHVALTPLPRTNRGLAPRSRRARGEGGDFRKRKRDHAITDADCAPFKKAGELRTSTVSFAWLERHDYKCLLEEERPFVRLKRFVRICAATTCKGEKVEIVLYVRHSDFPLRMVKACFLAQVPRAISCESSLYCRYFGGMLWSD